MIAIYEALIVIVILLVSLSIHEAAHAAIAHLYGDSTAKDDGRLSLNPIKHWDPLGTTLLVGLILVNALGLRVPVIGWGKPVPVNEDNFNSPRWDGLQTAIAGPLSNAALAGGLALAVRQFDPSSFWADTLSLAVYINVFLMFFNLLPIPPLDGSRILRLFMSDQLYLTLASNPIIFYLVLFVTLYYFVGPLQQASVQLSRFLLGG